MKSVIWVFFFYLKVLKIYYKYLEIGGGFYCEWTDEYLSFVKKVKLLQMLFAIKMSTVSSSIITFGACFFESVALLYT